MGTFRRGYEEMRKEKQRQDEAASNMNKKLFRFFIAQPERGNSTAEAEIRFLTEEPVNFYEHNIRSTRNGKEIFEQYTCSGENCPLCQDGDNPSFKGAFLVIDRRESSFKDRNGNVQHVKDQIKMFIQGTKVVSQLDRISSKYGLSDMEVTLVRLGRGTETTYTVERGDLSPLNESEIEYLLPDKLKDQYDGSMESLYDIIEEQLEMNMYGNTPEQPSSSRTDNAEDEEENDNDAIIGVEAEEEELPFHVQPSDRKPLKKRTLFKSKTKLPARN